MRNTHSQIKLNISRPKSSLCNYSDVYILASRTIAITGVRDDAATIQADERNKLTNINWRTFADCIREINNTQVDQAKYFDDVMPVYNLIEYRSSYLKKFRKFMAIIQR